MDHGKAEQTNLKLWDEIAPVHYRAYEEVDVLRRGGIALDSSEIEELGDVTGKRLLHLQCHIGTDTLSWARLGAHVTGVDFSPESLDCARKLQQELGLDGRFILSNVYDLPGKLRETFDIVYTSRGVLCWLRDLDAWAGIVARYLKPGGTFYIMETHPMAGCFEYSKSKGFYLAYPYYHSSEPMCWDAPEGDYADESYIPSQPSYEWQWTVSDIINSLQAAGLQLEHIQESDRLFFKMFAHMVQGDDGWYRLPEHNDKVPLLLVLRARKPA